MANHVASRCASPIQGTRARLTRLDECGIPVEGEHSLVVTDGFVQVAVTQNYEDGTEYQLQNALGAFCVNDRGPDQFLRSEVEVQFCAVDPDVVEIITGSDIITTGSPATGTGFWVCEGAVDARFSLEIWQNIAGQECIDGDPAFVYWAFPHLSAGRFNDFTIENGVLEWSLTGQTRRADPAWGTGPVDDDPWISQVPDCAHFGFNIATLPLPAITGCGAQPLVAA